MVTYLPCTFCSSTPWCDKNFSLTLSRARSTAGPHRSRSKGESRRDAIRTPTLYILLFAFETAKCITKNVNTLFIKNIVVNSKIIVLILSGFIQNFPLKRIFFIHNVHVAKKTNLKKFILLNKHRYLFIQSLIIIIDFLVTLEGEQQVNYNFVTDNIFSVLAPSTLILFDINVKNVQCKLKISVSSYLLSKIYHHLTIYDNTYIKFIYYFISHRIYNFEVNCQRAFT